MKTEAIKTNNARYDCQENSQHVLSSTQLETPIAHFADSPRCIQSMDTIHHDTGDGLNLDEVGINL